MQVRVRHTLVTECLFIQVSEWVSEWVGEWVSGWVSEWVREWGRQVSWLPPPPTIRCFPSFYHITFKFDHFGLMWEKFTFFLPDFRFRSSRSLSYSTPTVTILVDPAPGVVIRFVQGPRAQHNSCIDGNIKKVPNLTHKIKWLQWRRIKQRWHHIQSQPLHRPQNLATNTTTITITTTVLSLMMLQGCKV